jgi:hypothetical protein
MSILEGAPQLLIPRSRIGKVRPLPPLIHRVPRKEAHDRRLRSNSIPQLADNQYPKCVFSTWRRRALARGTVFVSRPPLLHALPQLRGELNSSLTDDGPQLSTLGVAAPWRETPDLFSSSPCSSRRRGELNFSSFNRPPASIKPNPDKPAEAGATQRTDRLCCVVNGRETARSAALCEQETGASWAGTFSIQAVAERRSPLRQRSPRLLRSPSSSGQISGIRTPRRQPATIANMVAPCCCRAKDVFTKREPRIRHGKNIGTPPSAGRNALPVSRPYSPSPSGRGPG